MSGPNLNLDYDPLEGPSTRIWKPKAQVDGRKIKNMKFFMDKFVDKIFAWKAGAAASDEKEPTPETDTERDEIKYELEEAPTSPGQEDMASNMRSTKNDREKLETLHNLAHELGSQMGPEQKVACGILFNMAIKENIFTSSKVDEEKLGKLQSLARELSANMPVSQRFSFNAMVYMVIERLQVQMMRHEEKEEQLPVEKEELDFELD